jgi:hypothetical protein
MTTVIPPPIVCLLNIDAVRKLYEAAWRDGFQSGADHGNLDYKYPPEDVAWLEHKREKTELFTCLTRQELKLVEAWEDAQYTERTNEARWQLNTEESAAETMTNHIPDLTKMVPPDHFQHVTKLIP